jgi:hypothetical protein
MRGGIQTGLVCVLLFLSGGVGAQQTGTVDSQAQTAAGQVLQSFGTGATLNANGMQPLSTGTPMQSVDGSQQFSAKVACQASAQFLRITMLPNASSDIQTLTLDMDPNFTGQVTSSEAFTGPFAGVCTNGIIRCDADSFNNCHYLQWQANTSSATVGVTEVSPEQLGACYCFDASCGNNLLWVNTAKVLSDIGSGVGLALTQLYPRLTIGRSQQLDAVTLVYYGQNASCGSDATPEQYFSHPQDLAQAGASASQQPGSVANFMGSLPAATTTSVGSMQCSITRNVALDEATRDGIISLASLSKGAWDTAAGANPACSSTDCVDFNVGDNGFHEYTSDAACELFRESALLNVARPDRIVSATLLRAQYDDHGQVWAGSALEFTSDWNWTVNGPFPTPPASCETSMDHSYTLGTDLTPVFTGAINQSVQLGVNTAVGGEGDGAAFFEVRVHPGCALGAETVTDGCTAEENNGQCGVWEEWVDGVQTVKDGLTTGLAPLPSSKTLQGTTCSIATGNRNWWVTTRTYQCTSSTSPYDFSAMMARQQSVSSSMDITTGNYTDRIVNSDGSVSNPTGNVTLPPAQPAACIQTCKTRIAQAGSEVGLSGPQSELNTTGVAWTFNYKNCTAGVCPLNPGEQVVSACDCQSNFAEAAAMMATIRQVQQDQTCSP